MPATKTRRGSSSRSKSTSRKSATRRAPQKKKVTSPEPGVVARSREAAGRQLAGHRADLFAVCLFVLGAIFALGLWTDLAGPVGSALADGTGAALGRARVAVPVACFAFGVVLLWPRRSGVIDLEAETTGTAEAEDPPAERPTVRIAIGALLLFLADVGILHLAYGRPSLSGNLDDLRNAGGALGAMVAGPLVAATGVVGASIVLGAVAAAGVLLVLGLSIGVIVGATARASRAAAVKARDAVKLAPIGEGVDLDAPPPHTGPAPFDYAQYDDEPEPAYFAEPAPEPEPVPAPPVPTASAAIEIPVVEDPSGQLSIALGDEGAPHKGPWKLPAQSLLKRGSGKEADRRLIDEGGRLLEATLAHHGVEARLVGTTVGPTVTRYELELGAGVKVNRVTGLSNDIQYAMASLDVRILAPIPGRSAVGVEVPNRERIIVTLGDVLAAPEVAKSKTALGVGLGRDISGKSVMLDVTTLPHVLIAGATGAGKSSCINSIVTSLLMRYTPDQVRLILVDPKRVELGAYNDLPHLLTEVVTNPKKAANALDWAVREMDMRYQLLADIGVRDITGYNARFDRGELPTVDDPDPVTGKGYERLPFIVIVVDELNDLMMVAARDVEASICRIAQMARAVGIHLIIATQRPSVDVITGVIKANVPSRMAFSVSSLADSRVILDQAGAEKLIGQGDMLLLAAGSGRAQRVQGSWVDEECVSKVVAHWRRQATKPTYVEGIADEDPAGGGSRAGGSGNAADEDGDDLLNEAIELVVRSGLGSTSMLQRKLRVGFARAGRLMDLMERRGIVGPSEGSKARSVLMTVEEFEANGNAA
ncbi:MAG TPA: DNA translocase FtsK 4TM domain-containing protein [Acidimicrobiia bacterium]